jgi:hypothetical protein
VKGVKENNEKRKYKVTLKYRDPNREESARQNASVSKTVKDRVRKKDIETKFEKDILPSKHMFSHSTSVKQKNRPVPMTPPAAKATNEVKRNTKYAGWSCGSLGWLYSK